MKLKALGLIAGTAFGLSFATPMAIAQMPQLPTMEDHLSEAISHTREAVVAGREGKPDQLVLHATTALDHAKAEQAEQPNNVHLRKAVNRLKEAIQHGTAKRRSAAKIADYALQELERAPNN